MAVGPVWEQDAAGSNPVTRTKVQKSFDFWTFFFLFKFPIQVISLASGHPHQCAFSNQR